MHLVLSMSTDKAAWHEAVTKIFVKVCFELILSKQLTGPSFTRKEWNNIKKEFQAQIEKPYDEKQLKDKFGRLKKAWTRWSNIRFMAGLGWPTKKVPNC